MALRDPRPGLRTIHNGSNAVAKASIVVAAGEDLTVSEDVAAQLQLQASGAFKDGAAPQALLDALAASAEPAAEPEASPEPEVPAAKPKRAATKK